MSDQGQTPAGQHGRHAAADAAPVTGWVGVIGFAAVIMIFLGVWNVFDGLVALFNDKYYVVGEKGVLGLDLTAWGWILLILGIVEIAAGAFLLKGSTWARVVTVVVAGLNALVQLAFVSAYPFGAVLIMVLGVVVIWAVVVHGDEVRPG